MLNSFAPPFKIVCCYFIFGFLFLFFAPLILWQSYFSDIFIFSPNSIGVVHFFLLGFVLNIIIGSLYQLTSVVLESKFGIIKFAVFNQIIFNIALLLFCLSFFGADLEFSKIVEWSLKIGLNLSKFIPNFDFIWLFGGVLFLSLFYFCVGFLLSFKGVKGFNFTKFTLLLAGIFLAFTILCGLFLTLILSGISLNLDFDLLFRYHIYFALGALYFVILASSCVLLPMFLLSHNLKFVVAKFGVFFYIIGGIFINFHAIFALLAVLCFCFQGLYILFKRARKAYDYWNLNIFWAIFCLILVCGYCVKFAISWDFDFEIFMILVGFGFFYPFITAHAYKILAFLVWYHYISPFAGKIKVPLLTQMVNAKFAYTALILNIFGVIFGCFGWKNLAFLSLEISVILFLINVFNILKFIKFKGNL